MNRNTVRISPKLELLPWRFNIGHNVDLTQLIGAPISIKCANCGNKIITDFDDYDIDCGNPNPQSGKWELECECETCGHTNLWNRDLGLPSTYDPKCKECGKDVPIGEKTGQCLECLDWKMYDLEK